MRPIDRLIFNSRVPPAVEQEHVLAKLQVQPHAARSVTHENHGMFGIMFEGVENAVAFIGGDFSVIFQRMKPGQAISHFIDGIGPLAEHNCFLAARRDLFQIGL